VGKTRISGQTRQTRYTDDIVSLEESYLNQARRRRQRPSESIRGSFEDGITRTQQVVFEGDNGSLAKSASLSSTLYTSTHIKASPRSISTSVDTPSSFPGPFRTPLVSQNCRPRKLTLPISSSTTDDGETPKVSPAPKPTSSTPAASAPKAREVPGSKAPTNNANKGGDNATRGKSGYYSRGGPRNVLKGGKTEGEVNVVDPEEGYEGERRGEFGDGKGVAHGSHAFEVEWWGC
jgi:hypothetical protein